MNKLVKKSYIIVGSIVLLVVVFLVGNYFINSTKEDVIQQDEQYLNEIAKQNSEYVNNMLQSELSSLDRISQNLQKQGANQPDVVVGNLKKEMETSNFQWLAYIAKDGMMYTTENVSMNVSNQLFYTKAMADETYISDRIVDERSDIYGNLYSVPLHNGTLVNGAIVAYKDSSSLAKYLNVEIFSGEGFSYIIKENGDVVVYDSSHKNNYNDFENLYSEMERNGMSKSEIADVKKQIKDKENGIFSYTRNGIDRLAAFNAVGVNDWYEVTVVPEFVVSEKSDAIIARNVLIFILVTILLTALLGFIIWQSRKSTKQLERLAYVDEITGTANFTRFKETCKHILKQYPKQQYVLIKMDFEAFNVFNQIYGYQEGNVVLKGVARIMGMLLDEKEEAFARVNADEFIILKKYEDINGLDVDYESFEHLLKKQIGSKYNYELRVRYGRYVIDDEMRDIEMAYERANVAHRIAKTMPDMRICDYDRSLMNERIRAKEIANRMEFALKSGQFKVFLQPKYDIETQQIVGAEALVRWIDGTQDVLYPDAFIPVFEKNGFIIKLDFYMFEQVCKLIRKWLDANLDVPTISVNFSTLHLKNTNFIQALCLISDSYQIPRQYLEIELTETAMIENAEVLEDFTKHLHEAGFLLAMDDFGVGYSSLGLLKNIAVDVIKLDRSFIWDVRDSGRSKIVLANIILLAKELRIKTVAEGVETQEQKELLRELLCDIVQGYYYSKPVDVETFEVKVFKSVVS